EPPEAEAEATPEEEAAGEASTEEPAKPRGKTVDELVQLALGQSGLVTEADGKVQEWKGRLAEVQSLYYPKLSARGYVAPMYRTKADSITSDPFRDSETDWGEWGPYFHLEATLVQPLYTFGRLSAGKDAAQKRLAVEEARARQTRNTLAFEVRKLYYLHLFTRSLQPALLNARKAVDGALKQARELYAEGGGKVTNVDLAKLEYGSAELDKFIIMAKMGEALSLAALKHTVGLPESAELVLADEVLPEPPEGELPALAELIRVASAERPEWAQVRHGKQAAISLESAERLANAPVVFAAAQARADYTAMRPNVKNPYYKDDYNGASAGAAVGLQWDFDPWKAEGSGDAARGLRTQVEGLEKFASSGIPLEVRKAYDDAVQAQRLLEVAERSSTAGRKWLTFAGSAYSAGTGEAKDLLEGLVASLQGRRAYFEQLQALHTARAYLTYATGRTGLEAGAPATKVEPAK
ncbi:MAG TPA: TolC family protein, partial [Aggregicoccus sp.]|nr:TolC family protein [Aggregicoccus sp.]